jgi:hypothetical protein
MLVLQQGAKGLTVIPMSRSNPGVRHRGSRILAGAMIVRLVIVLLAVGAVAWVAAMFVGHGMWLSAIIVVAAVVAARIAVPTSR